ncbi:MAG: T9SS type A sorting domain-containing protein [Bacteroidia bacterium]|nr:T9SS type A sorting domain-containing protein [Bacteroidia bacterium]
MKTFNAISQSASFRNINGRALFRTFIVLLQVTLFIFAKVNGQVTKAQIKNPTGGYPSLAVAAVKLGPDKIICPGDSVKLDAGKGFASYQWSTGATGTSFIWVSSPGLYWVLVKDPLGNMSKDDINVTQMAYPTASFTDTASSNMVAFFNNSANATVFTWDFGDGTSSNQANPIHQYATLGTYAVCLTSANQCKAVTICNPVSTGVLKKNEGQGQGPNRSLSIYPNPLSRKSGVLNVETGDKEFDSMQVLNQLGQAVTQTKSLNGSFSQINVSNLTPGIYFLQLTTRQGFETHRFILTN